MASPVDHLDAANLLFELGTSGSQGTCEALAILAGLRLWKSKLEQCRLTLTVQSDSITALAVTKRLSAKSPGLNFIGAELSLLLEEIGVQGIQQRYIPGRLNKAADYLSRPSTWAEESLPEALRGVKVIPVGARASDFYRLPTPGDQPAMWGPLADHPWWRH